MQSNNTTEPRNDSTITTVSHLQHRQEMQNNEKATENTCLTSNNSQTYFADEKIHIPEIENVVYIYILIPMEVKVINFNDNTWIFNCIHFNLVFTGFL